MQPVPPNHFQQPKLRQRHEIGAYDRRQIAIRGNGSPHFSYRRRRTSPDAQHQYSRLDPVARILRNLFAGDCCCDNRLVNALPRNDQRQATAGPLNAQPKAISATAGRL